MPASVEVAAFREDVFSAGGVQRLAEHAGRARATSANSGETSRAAHRLDAAGR